MTLQFEQISIENWPFSLLGIAYGQGDFRERNKPQAQRIEAVEKKTGVLEIGEQPKVKRNAQAKPFPANGLGRARDAPTDAKINHDGGEYQREINRVPTGIENYGCQDKPEIASLYFILLR